MNRRRFLRESAVGGALLLGGGGYFFFRRSQARAAMTSRLLADALPSLAASSLGELSKLPVRAREEIRRYFHEKCLNIGPFADYLCSHTFGERLGRCRSPEEQEVCFLQAFCGRVASEEEILNHVKVIAADIGNEMDMAWAAYCTNLSGRWNAAVQGYGSPLASADLNGQLDAMIPLDRTG